MEAGKERHSRWRVDLPEVSKNEIDWGTCRSLWRWRRSRSGGRGTAEVPGAVCLGKTATGRIH